MACSDGAGRIIAVGKKVHMFSVGDNVCGLFYQLHQAGPMTDVIIKSGMGGLIDGTLRKYATFPETALVLAPSNLSLIEAATLPCAPLTAWNALYGIESKALRPGEAVLTQGSGGVSLIAIQLARAAGAIVISTTSSDEKADFLKKIGSHHVINYKTDPTWGETAKKLSPGKQGVDHVIEVGGAATMQQSLKAVKREGVISVIGFLGGQGKPTSLTDTLAYTCIVRGFSVGSKQQFQAMNRAIEVSDIHPVVDKKVFGFEEVKDAYQYQWDQKNFGKVVIQLSK